MWTSSMYDEVSDIVLDWLRNMKVPHACGRVVQLLLDFHLFDIDLLEDTHHRAEDVGVHQRPCDQQEYTNRDE